MKTKTVKQLEMKLLLEGISQWYGYDFQQYARGSLERRISEFLKQHHCASPSELIPSILHDSAIFWNFVSHLSVPFTQFFRDPDSFRVLREEIIPYFHTFPFLKVWIAGCASGEEAYSLAILLYEEGLLERTQIYGTDMNPAALAKAERAQYARHNIEESSKSYAQAGGKCNWFDYFTMNGSHGCIIPDIQRALTFSKHNLIGDKVFGEMHLVLCRNVLIYFTHELQEQVINLLTKSLAKRGVLCLGPKESFPSSSVSSRFESRSLPDSIYRLRR